MWIVLPPFHAIWYIHDACYVPRKTSPKKESLKKPTKKIVRFLRSSSASLPNHFSSCRNFSPQTLRNVVLCEEPVKTTVKIIKVLGRGYVNNTWIFRKRY